MDERSIVVELGEQFLAEFTYSAAGLWKAYQFIEDRSEDLREFAVFLIDQRMATSDLLTIADEGRKSCNEIVRSYR